MYIEKTTAAERLIISNGMYDVMASVTRAKKLLMWIMNDFFGEADQKAIDCVNADYIGEILRAVNDALWTAETQYGLTVGEELPGCEASYEGAKRALLVRDVEQLREEIGCADTAQYLDLSDEELLPILQGLVKKKGEE